MKGWKKACLIFSSLGALLAAAACGGKAIIDPPLGSGGAGGAGGAGVASVTGTVSTVSTSSGMMSCDQIADAYEQAIAEARSCDPFIDTLQCTAAVQDELRCPCRKVFVNPFADGFESIDSLSKQWTTQGCSSPDEGCPLIGCVQPESGSCIESPPGSSSRGTCVDN